MSFWLIIIALSLYLVIIAACVGVVLSENRNPIRALAWTIALLFLPGVGLVFYLFFGRSLKGMKMISRRNKRKLMHVSNAGVQILSGSQPYDQFDQVIRLAHNLCNAPLTLNNNIKVYTDGISKFTDLKTDLQKASKSIFLQYYIFLDDNLGSEIAEILKEKALQGLTVCVIYDHVGSFSADNNFFKSMKEAGVKLHPFFRVTFPQLANRINWRNHRKIVVIDDEIGYIGGMNIADRYVMGTSDGAVWRDTHFRITGDIVQSLYYSFAIDWNFLNPKIADDYIFESKNSATSATGMQLITSGPTDRWHTLSLCFLKAISSANKRIYIQTPYFLPTDSLLQALTSAAIAKLDVRIMIPRTSDSRMLKYASYSYISTCLKAGIKVYLYEPGMLHAKMMIIDDEFVTAGSTNFDFRSFENNFECNLLIYDKNLNAAMRDIFFSDLKDCSKVHPHQWHKRPWSQKTAESILRLLSPIL